MRAQYEAAASNPTAYYGQLANARLGLGEIAWRPPSPEPAPVTARELVHAADILYSIGERDLAISFMTDLAKESNDVASVAAVGQVTARYNDAQTMLLIGKTALARGMAMDQYAFPDIGVPRYGQIGPQLDRCVVYSIVRTESGFDQRDNPPKGWAIGHAEGCDTQAVDGRGPVYNTQRGGRGAKGGWGPVRGGRGGKGRPGARPVDAVDWIERIPFAETRNYVQRVMENLQVYCARFGASTATVEPNLHRAAPVGSHANQVLVEAIP